MVAQKKTHYFLAENRKIIRKIDKLLKDVASANNPKNTIKKIHFAHIWRDLCIQENWPPQYMIDLSWKRKLYYDVINQLLESKTTSHAPILESSATATQNTGLLEYETIFGFRIANTTKDMWQPSASGFYSSEISENWIILSLLPQMTSFIDVGANMGYYSVLVGSQTEIPTISYEPERNNFSLLTKNVRANKLNHIVLRNAAISNNEKKLNLSINQYGSGGHSLKGIQSNVKQEVTCVTLNKDLANIPLGSTPFIKIDVEGFEDEVLRGSMDLIESKKPIILIEISPENIKNKTFILNQKVPQFKNYTTYLINKPVQDKPVLTRVKKLRRSDIDNYLLIPSHRRDLIDAVTTTIDLRVFNKTQRLQKMVEFIEFYYNELKN